MGLHQELFIDDDVTLQQTINDFFKICLFAVESCVCVGDANILLLSVDALLFCLLFIPTKFALDFPLWKQARSN